MSGIMAEPIYSEQQIQEMRTWIKNKEEYTIDEQYDVADINSFNEMQKRAYDIAYKSHFNDTLSEKEPLCRIVNCKFYQELVKVTLLMLLETFCKVNVLLLLPQVKQPITLEV